MVALAGIGLMLCPIAPLATIALPAPSKRSEILDIFVVWASIGFVWALLFYWSKEADQATTLLIAEVCWAMLCAYFWNLRSNKHSDGNDEDDGRDDDDEPPHGPWDWDDFDRTRQDWDSKITTKV